MPTLTNPTAADAAALNSYTFISGSIPELLPIDEIRIDSVMVPFGTSAADNIELHILNINDLLLESVYGIPYTLGPKADLSDLRIDIHSIFRELGYIAGKFNFKLNLHRDYLGTQASPTTLAYINLDRTEVHLYYTGTSDILKAPLVDNFSNRLEYFLNLGDNELYRIRSFEKNIDLSNKKITVYTIKLQSPLPNSVMLNSAAWVALQVADTITDSIVIYPKKKGDDINKLRPANYDINTIDRFAHGTSYKTWNQLLGTNPTSSQQLIDTMVSSSFSATELNIDYRNYANFVFYGSATERLKNFKYKLGLIEYYDSLLNNLSLIPYSATESNNNIVDLTAKKSAILAGFDGYEKYLYYSSGSYESSSLGEFTPATWPKSTSTYPYTLYGSTSNEGIAWYNGQLSSASLFDKENMNSLKRLMPTFMIDSGYYDSFEMFANMLGQHFDILWSYANSLGDIKSRDASVYDGLAKELIYHVLKSFGIDVLNGYQADELWFNELPVNISGSYTQLGELPSIASKDINAEVFKRILNNLPYLLKTKGTERGIRALINCYGVPSTVYRIREYSGPYTYKSKNILRNTKYKKVEKYTQAVHFSGSWTTLDPYENMGIMTNPQLDNSGSVQTVQVRFKTTYNQPVTQSILSGYYFGSTLNAVYMLPSASNSTMGTIYVDGTPLVTGSFYNGQWNNLTLSVAPSGTGSLFVLQNTDGVMTTEATASFINGAPATASSWILGNTDGTYMTATTFSGSMQEFRLWNSILPIEIARQHALNPQSIIGSGSVDVYTSETWQSYNNYDYTSGYNQLLFRCPLGSTLQLKDPAAEAGTLFYDSIHPNKTSNQVQMMVFPPYSMDLATWTGSYMTDNYEDYYVWSPNLGDSLDIANKIRIEDAKLDGQLSNTNSIEHSQYDQYQLDSPKVGVFFSPQDEINEDIADQFSGLLLDDLIGDPRDDYKPSYSKLDQLRSVYNSKYTDRNTFWKYMKLVENFDSSMFYLIKKFLPARSVKLVGLVVQPTILERPKINVQRPIDFENVALETGLDLTSTIDFNPSYDTYEATISVDSLDTSGSDYIDMLAQIAVTDIMLPAGDVDILAATITTEFGSLQDDGYQEVSYIHDNTDTIFKGLAQQRHSFVGCKITSPGFNIPSPDTLDGKPVIEYWTTGPTNMMNQINPGGLLNL